MTPRRIQRKRAKGWRMPEGAVNVGRPTKWGNPFKIGLPHPDHGGPMSRAEAIDNFAARRADRGYPTDDEIQAELRGRDLACWCDLEAGGNRIPCHADVLLEIANAL